MLSNEKGKFGKMTFLLEHSASEFCLRHLAVEVRRHNTVECPGNFQTCVCTRWPDYSQYLIVLIKRQYLECLGQEDLNLNDVVYIAFL